MKRLVLLAFVPLLACASAQAKTSADRPLLDVPPVPPRVVEPIPAPPPERPAAPAGAASDSAPTQPDRATNRQTTKPPASRETAKQEPKPDPPPSPPAEAPLPPTPSVPPLRTPGTASDGAEASRNVREVLDRAKRALDNVDLRTLGNEQKEQFNQARLFMTQAEEKLKSTDFELARSFADKADQIARQLQKR